MNNKELISSLSLRVGYSQQATQKLVTTMLGDLLTLVEEEQLVVVPNFGTFEVKKRLERILVNPSSGNKMLVPPKLTLHFRQQTGTKGKKVFELDELAKEFFSLTLEQLEADKVVKIKGLGTFKLVETSARESIDINTRERITIESRERIQFSPSEEIKKRINSPFEQFAYIDLDEEALAALSEPEPVPVVPTPEPEPEPEPEEEEEEEDEDETEPKNKTVIILLWCILIALILGFGLVWWHLKQAPTEAPQATETELVEPVVEEPTPNDSIVVEEPAAVDPLEAMNADSRLKNGAYVIVGHMVTVTALPDQTFKGICRAHLGDGMQSYVEVYNGGKNTVEVGDTIRIPKLKTKKQVAYEQRKRDN